MNRSFLFFPVMVILALMAVSCVPGKKYRSLEDTSRQFMNERDAFKTESIELSMTNRELEAKIASLEKEAASVKQALADAEAGRDKAKEDLNALSGRYNDLQNAQEELIGGNVKETRSFLKNFSCTDRSQKKEYSALEQSSIKESLSRRTDLRA